MVERGRVIGVLMGGLSTERDISLATGHAVLGALRERGWYAVEVPVGRDLPSKLQELAIDVAWIALHGRFGEDGCVQGLLEMLGVPYTGSGVRASALAMDKVATKRHLASDPAVTLARDAVVYDGDVLPDILPCVVKPAVGGSTIGIALCQTQDELREAVAAALLLDSKVLVEELIKGDEITVAVIDGEPLPVVRIVPESGFFDFEAKYTKGKTRYEVPAQVTVRTAERAKAAAVAAYDAIGCQGLARADFMVRDDGEPVFLEINTLPGMTATSLSPMAASAVGVGFPELVERILHGAHVMSPEREA
jgi:D-alanine-D-alanine ligase